MRSSNLKTDLSNELESQIVAFLAKNGKIEEVPITAYKREDVTLRDRRTILQVGTQNAPRDKIRKSGDAIKDIDRKSWKQRLIKEGKL